MREHAQTSMNVSLELMTVIKHAAMCREALYAVVVWAMLQVMVEGHVLTSMNVSLE